MVTIATSIVLMMMMKSSVALLVLSFFSGFRDEGWELTGMMLNLRSSSSA